MGPIILEQYIQQSDDSERQTEFIMIIIIAYNNIHVPGPCLDL